MTEGNLLTFRRLRPRRFRFSVEKTRSAIGVVETMLYVVVGVLLAAAGAAIVLDTITGFVDGLQAHAPTKDLGLRFLDRVLLLLISLSCCSRCSSSSRAARSRPSRSCSSGSSRSCGT